MSLNKALITRESRINLAKSFVQSINGETAGSSVYAFISKTSRWERSVRISGISQSNPAVVTASGHGLKQGDVVEIRSVSGMTQLNNWSRTPLVVDNPTESTFEILGIDSTEFSTYEGDGVASVSMENDWPPVQDTDEAVRSAWREMIGAKRLDGTNVSFVVPRHAWESEATYEAYDGGDANMKQKRFYCVNSVGGVYKCLWNNGGSRSTIEPSGRSLVPVHETDGYVWKYMFTVPDSDDTRFGNRFWIPVKTLEADDGTDQWDVQNTAVPGTVDGIVVTNSGSSYSHGDTMVEIVGDGVGAEAVITGSGLGVDGGVVTITVTNKGSGYTWADAVVKSSTGMGCSTRVLVSPPNGHGSDPIKELNSYFVMMTVDMVGDEDGKFMVDNDFRKFGIVRNPTEFDGSRANAYSYDMRRSMSMSSVKGIFLPDEEVVGEVSRARGVVSDVTQSGVNLVEVDGTFHVGETVRSEGSGLATVESFGTPELLPNTGETIYLENRGAVTRMRTQSELFKSVLVF